MTSAWGNMRGITCIGNVRMVEHNRYPQEDSCTPTEDKLLVRRMTPNGSKCLPFPNFDINLKEV
ncbi:hypothetical protein J6590_096691 [Homalodisca vitripennis]|nr:hypothetical protein J6590_096691 [Homalodisca vitripennis]